MNTCHVCGCALAHDGRITLGEMEITIPLACDSCAAKAERDRAKRDALARWERAEDEMLMPANARAYMRPPAALESRNPAAWSTVRGWDRVRNLFMWGPEGVGKSSAAKYALGRAVLDGVSVAFLPCTRIERELWQIHHAETIDRVHRARLLVLDDLTNAPWTARGVGVLRDLIDVKHETGGRLIVTANHNPEDTARVLGRAADAVYIESMLRRLHPVTVLEFTGDSYRKELSK